MSNVAHNRHRRYAVAGVTAVVVLVGGLAYAFWTVGGSGVSAGATSTNANVTLTPGTPSATLSPGGLASVVLDVSNPNLSPVHIGTFALDTGQGTGGFAVDVAHSGCSVAALSFATQSNGGSGWTVPAKVGTTNGTLAVTLANALSMSVGAADACQGATFTVFLGTGA